MNNHDLFLFWLRCRDFIRFFRSADALHNHLVAFLIKNLQYASCKFFCLPIYLVHRVRIFKCCSWNGRIANGFWFCGKNTPTLMSEICRFPSTRFREFYICNTLLAEVLSTIVQKEGLLHSWKNARFIVRFFSVWVYSIMCTYITCIYRACTRTYENGHDDANPLFI